MSIQDIVPTSRLDRSRHAAPQVFEKLRELIVGLELTPGTVLPRNELADRFGLSQTPIRDALMRLGEEGLVDIFPQHATVVSRINIASARQAHFLRRSIELEIVHTLAQCADEALNMRLQAHINRQKSVLDPANYSEFIAADQAFHREMHEAAGMCELWRLAQRYSGHVDRLRRLHLPEAGKAQKIVDDHQRILDAIASRDAAAAQMRLREHLSGTLNQIEQICKAFPDYITLD